VGNGTAKIALGAAETVSNLVFGPAAGGSYVLSGSSGNSLQLADGGSSASISVASGASAIQAPVVLGDNLNVTAGGGTSLTISGPMGESGGSHRLTLFGEGSLTLSGANTYTGGTFVMGGTLLATASGALPNGGALMIGAGGTVIFGPSVTAPGDTTAVSTDTTAATSSDASATIAVPQAKNLSKSVLAAVLRTPAADRLVCASTAKRIVRDPAWLGQAANSSENSDEQRKKDVAILALDAVLAQYGQ
jgi:autotransporter-associated beta strand protein